METRQADRNTEKINCKTCDKEYTPMCDYMQGRCPYHPSMIKLPSLTTRFTNLIKFLQGK